MSSPWQEGCLARCQDCTTSCAHHEPYKRFMTIGAVRYGMRVGAVSPPPPGAGPRYRSRTCCWSGAPGHESGVRVPLLFAAPSPINSLDKISCVNRSEDAAHATSEQTQTVRDHVPSQGGCLLNKRCALVYSRLLDQSSKDDFATLDRLPRFRFGGNRTEKRGSEKFRELTERLKRSAASTPVPPPRRHTRVTPPPPPVVEPLVATVFPQRTNVLPSRSASFSQVDYCPDDNKYVRRSCISAQDSADSNTLPRPKNVPKPKHEPSTTTKVPELQITPDSTLVRPQFNQERRRDRSRRRIGIYLSQWPTDLYSKDVEDILPKYQEATKNEKTFLLKEESDKCQDTLKTLSRSSSLLRSDSEGEPEQKLDCIVSDLSDCESRLSSGDFLAPSIPRRYSKRPLRGPYGQMLEAEMKKPETRKNVSGDLKFLEDLSTSGRKNSISRGSCNSSIDESFMRSKRKTSADNLVVEQMMKQNLVPNHQRTISSPSKLEVFKSKPMVTKEYVEDLLRKLNELLDSKEIALWVRQGTRSNVLLELLENESIYVESLHIIVTVYMDALKKHDPIIVEPSLVEEIFYQIPLLLAHHAQFLTKLYARFQHLDSQIVLGDLFLEMLATPDLIENYVIYINSWKRSRDIIKHIQNTKPQFAKFLEGALKLNNRKLPLDSLLIRPIQRFPKYELLLQRLVKHTTPDHPDFEHLTKALGVVHDQLLLINCTEKEALDIEQLRELESLIEGAVDLVAIERQLIRNDMVVMSSSGGPKKDRVLFLLTDLLLITGVKRRSGTITKKANVTINTTNLEANKYKLVMKVPLEDVEIVKSKDEKVRRVQLEVDRLNEDIGILNKMSDLAVNLRCNHSSLDDLIKEMIGNLNKQVQTQQSTDTQQCELHLSVVTQNGIENISIEFHKPEIRASWEETLIEYQAKLGDRRPIPELFAILPIRKTRAGLVLSSAAPAFNDASRDVWLCNSDGHVGQICILNLNEKCEPTLTSCNGICSSRILCITSVPGPSFFQSRTSSFSSVRSREKAHKAFDISSSSSEDDDEDSKSETKEESSSVYSEQEFDKATMWIGTEEGSIQIYNANENIRIKKNKVILPVGSSVLSIVYLEDKVYVSQANGYILIFERDDKGAWNTSNPRPIIIGNSNSPISKMIVWNSKIICACVNTVALFDPQNFEKETIITINIDFTKDPESHHICSLLVAGNSIWLCMQNSAVIKCYNAMTYELICETSIAPAVQRMLSCYDHIIRQHKAACLRVTSLLICKDLLWIGTSAGVVLTMSLPHVTPTTGKIPRLPSLIGVPHGNTGQVRVLAAIDLPYTLSCKETPSKKNSKNKTVSDIPPIKASKYLVVSGGEGYEDFRMSASEGAGREDSTNHVLLWTI
ncbi:hypothetical protein ABEB36_011305 [Hypothenemus hampei]|uniref:DH domain-containing protein n=1 Tax=Hypothenemus hampei TaxID=57062 RepID=A0ABD1EEY4_HYPHA